MKHLKQFNQFLNEEALNEAYLDRKSPAQIKKMHKLLKDAATLVNDFLYYGTDEQQKHAKNIHGTGGMYKLMNSIDQFLNEEKNESLVNEVNSRIIDRIVTDRPYTFIGGGRNGKVIVDGPLKDDDRLEIVHRAKKAGYHAELNDEGDLVIDMDRRF